MDSGHGQSNGPHAEEPGKGKHRSWPDWRPRPEELKLLGRLSGVSGPLAALLTFVAFYVHGRTVIVASVVGLFIVIPVAFIAVYRAVTKETRLPIAVVVGGGIVTVLFGAAIGFVIRTVTGGPASAETPRLVTQASAPAIARPSTAPTQGQASSAASQTPSTATVSGTIAVPRPGALITGGAMLKASGTVLHLPSGYRLDLFLRVSSVDRYYAAGNPNSALTVVDGKWSGAIYIGAGGPCTVYLVELSPASVVRMNSLISDQRNGYPSITALGIILASVSLTAE